MPKKCRPGGYNNLELDISKHPDAMSMLTDYLHHRMKKERLGWQEIRPQIRKY